MRCNCEIPVRDLELRLCVDFDPNSGPRNRSKTQALEGGPNYYVLRLHRIGDALLGVVRRALDEGTITYTKASRVLGVKPRNVERLLSMRGER